MNHQETPRHHPSLLFATGQATYTDDVPVPGDALVVTLGLSTIAHGSITSLDLSDVRTSAGVRAVLTAADLPGANRASLLGHDPIFAAHTVEYAGQCIFAVIAESEHAGRVAATRAHIRYQTNEAIISLDQARATHSLLCPPLIVARGEAETELQRCTHHLEGSLDIGGQEHFYMEGQVAVAIPEEDGKLRLIVSTQHPADVQLLVAKALGSAANQVTVQCPRLGGGFGGKETQAAPFACIAALASLRTGKVVKLRVPRRDDFHSTGKRHDLQASWSAGFDDQGRLQALCVRLDLRCGFSNDLSIAVATRALLHVDNAYYIPHVRFEANLWRTHTASNTAFRGFGAPQAMLVIEQIMDEIAARLDIDPVQVRQRNYYGDAGRNETPYGMRVGDSPLQRITGELLESADYAARKESVAAWNQTHQVLKRGLAFVPVKFGIAFAQTHLNQGAALLHVYTDGSILVAHGGTEMGQGLADKITHVVERAFGVARQRIRIAATDTAQVPNATPTAASASSDLNGHAAVDAVNQVKRRLLDFAAHHFGCARDACDIRDDRLQAPGLNLPFDELVELAYKARIPLSATGFYATPDIHFDNRRMTGQPFFYFVHGAAISEVMVDVFTGEHTLVRVDILQDCGESLDATVDLGQIEGAFMQGVGWLTMEELSWSPLGILLTDGPATYKIPTSHDAPPVFNVRLAAWSQNRPESLFRSKGVGEPPLPLAISAFLALRNAIGTVSRGAIRLRAPATPEAIMDALESPQ